MEVQKKVEIYKRLKLNSWAEFNKLINDYERQNNLNLSFFDCRKNDDFKKNGKHEYTRKVVQCYKSGMPRSRGKSEQQVRGSQKEDCPFKIRAKLTKDKKAIEISMVNLSHRHSSETCSQDKTSENMKSLDPNDFVDVQMGNDNVDGHIIDQQVKGEVEISVKTPISTTSNVLEEAATKGDDSRNETLTKQINDLSEKNNQVKDLTTQNLTEGEDTFTSSIVNEKDGKSINLSIESLQSQDKSIGSSIVNKILEKAGDKDANSKNEYLIKETQGSFQKVNEADIAANKNLKEVEDLYIRSVVNEKDGESAMLPEDTSIDGSIVNKTKDKGVDSPSEHLVESKNKCDKEEQKTTIRNMRSRSTANKNMCLKRTRSKNKSSTNVPAVLATNTNTKTILASLNSNPKKRRGRPKKSTVSKD